MCVHRTDRLAERQSRSLQELESVHMQFVEKLKMIASEIENIAPNMKAIDRCGCVCGCRNIPRPCHSWSLRVCMCIVCVWVCARICC